MIAFHGSLLQETLAFTTINGASSTDATTFAGTSGVDVIALVNQSNVYLYGAQNNDVVNATTFNGTFSGYTLNGGAGNDTYTVGTAPTVQTQIVNSSINGNTGNDTLTAEGILVSSTIAGGQDSDTITINGGASAYINGNKGNDTIVIGNAIDLPGSADYTSSTIRGGQGGDSLLIEAGATIFGDLYGDKGTDFFSTTGVNAVEITGTVYGGDDGDVFSFASAGNGVNMSGDEGSDNLTGAIVGENTLTGGAGNDTFNAAPLQAEGAVAAGDIQAADARTVADFITDFTNNADVIVGSGATAIDSVLDGGDFEDGIYTGSETTFNLIWADIEAVINPGEVAGFSFAGSNYIVIGGGVGEIDYVAKVNNSLNSAITLNADNDAIISIV